MCDNSGVRVVSALGVFLLPFGRPGRRLTEGGCFLASALALLAAFSASLRTTCSTRIGNERRCSVLINDNVKKARPGTGLPYRLEKNRSRPWVCLPVFGGNDLIACQHVDILWTVHMLAKEHPKQDGPWECLGEKTLDGAVTAAWACPARDAEHRDPSRHREHGPSNPAELAAGGGCQIGLEAV